MKLRALIILGLALATIGLGVLSCSKSRESARVTEVHMEEPGSEDAPYRILATIEPSGSGGPVTVTLRLRDKNSGEVVQRDAQVQLQPGVVLVVVGEIPAPRGDYEPEAEVQT